MKKAIYFLLLLLPLTGAAQIPGYMGKRLSVGYSIYIGPTLLYPAFFSTDDGDPGLRLTHCLNMDYVIRPRSAFSASIQYGRAGLTYDRKFDVSRQNVVYDPKDDRVIGLSMLNASLGFKFFHRGKFAPLGKYTKFDIVVINGKVLYDPNGFYNDETNPRSAVSIKGDFRYTTFAAGITFGRQRVFYDKLIVDTGVRFALTPQLLSDGFTGDGYLTTSLNSRFENNFLGRVAGAQFFNFHLGFSFLAH